MKKILVCMFMLLPFMSIMAQQVSHTVQRGETLESIAKKYNVSVYALTQSNPDAKDVFYVGMKLVIPSTKATKKEVKESEKNNTRSKEIVSPPQPVVDTPSYDQIETREESTKKKSGFIQPVDGMINAQDVTIMLDPDNKYYGIRVTTSQGWFGIILGGTYQFVEYGADQVFFGLGLSPKYTVGPLLVGVSLYPYVNMYTAYEPDGTYSNGKPKIKDKQKFGYGGMLDISAGLKVYTTQKGHDVYVTGSYHVEAFEFKTEGAFKNGMWGIGISWTL